MRIVLVAAALWAAGFSLLAVDRHEAFQSNAFDLGYVTQTLWSTVHGRPFVFTTLDGAPFSPEESLNVDQLRRPHSLLAFHVEPFLLLVAPLFAAWPDPRLLLVLQALGLAAGAPVAAALARRRLGHPAAPAFGLVYLLSPSLAAAALSDFHAVSFAAPLLLVTLYLFATGHRRAGTVAALLAASTREDSAVLVAALGAYLVLRQVRSERGRIWAPWRWRIAGGVGRRGEGRRETEASLATAPLDESSPLDPLDHARREGAFLFLSVGAYVVVVFFLIVPLFNGTLSALLHHQAASGSIFWHRYAWLGATPVQAARNAVGDPGRLVAWIAQRDVFAYLGTLALSGGGVALLAPEALAVALPIVLQDSLSSFDWMRSGGAHYSANLVPLLVFAAIEGVRRLRAPPCVGVAPTLAILVAVSLAAANQVWLGASPLAPGYVWAAPDANDRRIEAILAPIPRTASVAATSAVYPHLASRDAAYWFPALNGADYVAVDAARSTDPIGPGETRARVETLLSQGGYGVAAVAPGFVLLRREDAGRGLPASLPASFDDFARGPVSGEVRQPAAGVARFGEELSLDGYRLERHSTQTVFGPSATLETDWHAAGPITRDVSFAFTLTRRGDGAIVGELRDQAPEAIWYPPRAWAPGETVHLTVQLPRLNELQAVGVAVIDRGSGQRRRIAASNGSALWDNGTVAEITRLDQ